MQAAKLETQLIDFREGDKEEEGREGGDCGGGGN